MKAKTTDYKHDAILPLTLRERAVLAELAKRPDNQIDYSDIPALDDARWQGAERGRFYRPLKQQVTTRLDADVLDWLKAQGKGYQSRLNDILRRAMLDAGGSRRQK